MPDMNSQGREKKISDQNFRKKSISSGNGKTVVKRKKAESNSLSPSQKFIREFKKRELHKYGTPLNSPETTKSEITEWQVLYSTQVTQKAKKYHDGFLQLAACGSHGRQIMLFDETRKLLNNRFLRREEVIRSGESIAFDSHLVEIGKCEDTGEHLVDLKVQRNSCNITEKSDKIQRPQSSIKSKFKKSEVSGYGVSQNSPVPTESNITEWQVMYTTHVTQKAKKYHDGFLKLVIAGYQQRQIKLYDEGRKLLNSRFLKKDEVITSGESIAFDGHLVDIGEPQVNYDVQVQRNNCNDFQNTEVMHRHKNCLPADKLGKHLSKASSREIVDSSCSISAIDGIKLCTDFSTNKPLRNASQILSVLQKPMAMKSNDVGSTGNHQSCKNKDIIGPKEVPETEICSDLVSSQSMSKSPGNDRRTGFKETKWASKADEFPSFDLEF